MVVVVVAVVAVVVVVVLVVVLVVVVVVVVVVAVAVVVVVVVVISRASFPLADCCHSMQKFTILPIDISVETGDITPSLKLKRSELEAK